MRRAEQHDAADDRLAMRSEQGVGMRRHRAAVFVAGMRGDQQLRWRARDIVVGQGAGQTGADLRAQCIARGGIEQAVDDGTAYGRHRARLLTLNVNPCRLKVNARGVVQLQTVAVVHTQISSPRRAKAILPSQPMASARPCE